MTQAEAVAGVALTQQDRVLTRRAGDTGTHRSGREDGEGAAVCTPRGAARLSDVQPPGLRP